MRWQVSQMKSFLDNSFFHHARSNLGWREEESPDTLDASHESLQTSKFDDAVWKSELLPSLARSVWDGAGVTVGCLVRDFAAGKSWDMAFPEATLAQAQAEGLLSWSTGIVEMLDGLKGRYPHHALVTGADLSLGNSTFPSVVERTIDGRKFTLVARIPCALVPADPADPVILMHCVKTIEGNSKRPASASISQSYGVHLVAMAMAAAGRRNPVVLALFGREAGSDLVLEPARTAPMAWFDGVLTDMLAQRSQYLPGKTLLELGEDNIRHSAVREALGRSLFPDPLEELFTPTLPGEEEGDEKALLDLAIRRLAPFLGGADGA
jgi:hypothetical protein